jgi:predicted secreted protein
MGKIVLRRITWLLLTCFMLSPSLLLAADATITVTKEQGGREIALKVGDILRIELPGKGGTGYSWFAEANGAPYLKLMDQTTRQLKEGRVGGPVMQVWRFKAAQPGATEIKLDYYRPWEGAGKAVDQVIFKLRIEKP